MKRKSEPQNQRLKPQTGTARELKPGVVIVDNVGQEWTLGNSIGTGGFGEIYDITASTKAAGYVAKIEKHTNGPLFVEINCYLRLGKLEMIEEWKQKKKLNFLGLPYFIASGSCYFNDDKYRFLVIPKYHEDLEKILQTKRTFNLKTVLVIASRIIDTLEYIHAHGYIHSDIKASNIMLGRLPKKTQRKSLRLRHPIKRFTPVINCRKPRAKTPSRKLRSQNGFAKYIDDIPYLEEVLMDFNAVELVEKPFEGDEVYLLDYGLASKFLLTNGKHREFSVDQRRAHAGTILFCSRDAHRGLISRRSDLECLAYNVIYWLTGALPWIGDVEEADLVEKKKTKGFNNIQTFLNVCFNNPPSFLTEMFNYLAKLEFTEAPNYDFFRNLFHKTIISYGYADDNKLDLDNTCEQFQKKIGKYQLSILSHTPLQPLSSNIIFKRPKLRKKIKNKLTKDSLMNWSKILMDPETIIKQATTVRKSPDRDKIQEIDLDSLNPTPAMREVYLRIINNCEECFQRPQSFIDGFTLEMMKVYERQQNRLVKSPRKRGRPSKVPRTDNTTVKSKTTSHNLRKTSKRSYSLRG